MCFEYVRERYGVPAEYGRRVVVNGRAGVVAEDCGHHIGVNFDADRPGVVRRCHPTWEVTYGEMAKVRPVSRAQQRYRRYLKLGDGFDSFLSYCRWDTAPERSWNARPSA